MTTARSAAPPEPPSTYEDALRIAREIRALLAESPNGDAAYGPRLARALTDTLIAELTTLADRAR